MVNFRSSAWNRLYTIALYAWLIISLFFGYRQHLDFISKMRDANQEHINVYFASEVISKLRPPPKVPILIVLPPNLSVDERWLYHYRIRYRLYPYKIDFAEPAWGTGLRKVSYDYRQYKGKMPITIDTSNLLPVRTSDYRYILTIAGAKVDLPGFVMITDAEDVKGAVYKRVH